MTDFLTVLTSRGPILTKRWTPAGIEPYDRAKNFTAEAYQVEDIAHLSRTLTMLEEQPRRCVVRGRHLAHDDAGTRHEGGVETTRDLEHFTEAAHHWVCLDVDNWLLPPGVNLDEAPAAVAAFIADCLPAEFQEVTHHWQLSSSAGAPGKEHLLKAHIWFWLDQPRTGDELEHWARSLALPVDVTVFRTVQVHYTAGPVFEGVADPINQRSGLSVGLLGDEVVLVVPEFDGDTTPRGRAIGRSGMADPRSKTGLHGAFCRLYSPARVIDEDLCEGRFAWEGDSDARLSWTHGDHPPGGLCITDDELHIYNSHSTDPFEGRAVNVWDFVREHRFGELDGGLEPDAVVWLKSTGGLPSELAMRSWVRTLDDVVSEIDVAEKQQQDQQAAQEHDRIAEAEAALQAAKDSIVACPSTGELERLVAPKLADQTWSDGERAQLVKALQDRFHALTGVRLPVADARRWLEGNGSVVLTQRNAAAPDWLDRWVYVNKEKVFFDLDRKITVDSRAFDALHTDKMPLRQGSTTLREPASLYAVHAWAIRTVDYTMYAPPKAEVFAMDGNLWANTYDPTTAPECEPGGEDVIRMVESYMRRQFPDERERGLLMSWLAHQVRRPGIKVRWAPYIYGVEGAGKSFLAELLDWTMGGPNVKRIDGKTLTGDFTGWAAGKAVSVIEEVRQIGHFYDVVESLKAPITNDKINIHRKGLDDFEAPNFTSYIILSNHADGIPITASDRRYFFLKALISTDEAKALSDEGYYQNLFDTCRAAAGQLRRWLMDEVPMHPEFDPNGRAPITEARARVIEMVKTDPEVQIEDLLTGRDAVSAGYLAAKLKSLGTEAKTRTLSGLLSRAGFEYATRLRLSGSLQRVWVRSGRIETRDDAAIRNAASWMKLDEFAGMAGDDS